MVVSATQEVSGPKEYIRQESANLTQVYSVRDPDPALDLRFRRNGIHEPSMN